MHRLPESHRPPRATWLLYAVGLANIAMVFIFGGVRAGISGITAGIMLWAGAILHERYSCQD